MICSNLSMTQLLPLLVLLLLRAPADAARILEGGAGSDEKETIMTADNTAISSEEHDLQVLYNNSVDDPPFTERVPVAKSEFWRQNMVMILFVTIFSTGMLLLVIGLAIADRRKERKRQRIATDVEADVV